MTAQKADLQALQLALKMETDGYNFFKDAATRAQNPLTKEAFEYFAKWELEHVEFIKKMYQKLNDTGEWLSVELMNQKVGDAAVAIKTIFKQKHEEIDKHVKVATSDLEAYVLARDIEDKATVFYKQKADAAADPSAKKFFTFMIDVEREHYNILNNSYRYLQNPSLYNLEEENWMFDGG
ncbi:MAG: ferritin family protein [candidate division KSB1 bacterium]|nr:ferritin family protein [candidate division KSB1 bacterium]